MASSSRIVVFGHGCAAEASRDRDVRTFGS
jgi:hypothetical protein